MKITSILAIYLLFWVLAAFLVMPFGLRTPDEAGTQVGPGHAESAPINFRPGRVAWRATLLSAALFALFYANYLVGWIKLADIDFFAVPNSIATNQY